MSNETTWDRELARLNVAQTTSTTNNVGGFVEQIHTSDIPTQNCIIPGHHDWLHPYDTLPGIYYPYTYVSTAWREENGGPVGPCFVVDLPGVPPENVRVELKDDRWLHAFFTRVDGLMNCEQCHVIDLQDKRIDPASAEATFRLCVLRVQFTNGRKVPSVRPIKLSG